MTTEASSGNASASRDLGCVAVGCGGLLVLLVAGLVAAFLLLNRPVLVFTNRLVVPVRLAVEGEPARTVAPGATVRLRLSDRDVLVAEWQAERPLSPDRRPLGVEMAGSVVVRDPGRLVRAAAEARGAHGDFFAPLITNATDEQLRIVVNAGLAGALDCGCAVRPGATRAFIGYYPHFRNSTVQARGRDGRRATFRDLGPEVRDASGTVGLRFAPGDLRAP